MSAILVLLMDCDSVYLVGLQWGDRRHRFRRRIRHSAPMALQFLTRWKIPVWLRTAKRSCGSGTRLAAGVWLYWNDQKSILGLGGGFRWRGRALAASDGFESCIQKPGRRDEIPPELGRLTKLEQLNLEGSALTGNIPVELVQPHRPGGTEAFLEQIDW